MRREGTINGYALRSSASPRSLFLELGAVGGGPGARAILRAPCPAFWRGQAAAWSSGPEDGERGLAAQSEAAEAQRALGDVARRVKRRRVARDCGVRLRHGLGSHFGFLCWKTDGMGI
jgi:hypothetical protein